LIFYLEKYKKINFVCYIKNSFLNFETNLREEEKKHNNYLKSNFFISIHLNITNSGEKNIFLNLKRNNILM
jgi:hypothetical protein